jgi:hypothetical protein
MNRTRIIGLLLVTAGIILNQLELENDLADFLMGLFVGAGLVFLITGRITSKSKI